MLWVISIYVILGILVNLFILYKEPIILYAGWLLVPYFILGIIIFPYALYSYLSSKDTGGRWI